MREIKLKDNYLGSLLLELIDSSVVNTTAFEDQVTGGGRFTRIYMTNNNDVKMGLILITSGLGWHGCNLLLLRLLQLVSINTEVSFITLHAMHVIN